MPSGRSEERGSVHAAAPGALRADRHGRTTVSVSQSSSQPAPQAERRDREREQSRTETEIDPKHREAAGKTYKGALPLSDAKWQMPTDRIIE